MSNCKYLKNAEALNELSFINYVVKKRNFKGEAHILK